MYNVVTVRDHLHPDLNYYSTALFLCNLASIQMLPIPSTPRGGLDPLHAALCLMDLSLCQIDMPEFDTKSSSSAGHLSPNILLNMPF